MIYIPNYSSSEISSSEPSEEGHQGHHEYIFVIIFFLWQYVYIPLKPLAGNSFYLFSEQNQTDKQIH